MCAAKAKEDSSSLGGAFVAGAINVVLGVLIAFCVLANTAPQAYSPTPKKDGGPPPPLPAGVWYWPGAAGEGDWRGQEAAFLAGTSPLGLADTDLNGWAQEIFKVAPPAAAKPGAGNSTAAPSFAATPGIPNFRSYFAKDAGAGYFQVAMPFGVQVLGFNLSVLYQARGTFVSGAQGPEFVPSYSSLGSARVPGVGGLTTILFNKLAAEFTPADAAKKYAGAWAKYNSATAQDGQLVLAHQ
jgi:hypothetical protein